MIYIKTKQEIERMRNVGHRLAVIMDVLEQSVRPGRRTRDLERMAKVLIASVKAKSAFKGYQGYPTALCVSINEELVHGVPGWRKIKEGDIVTIDCGIVKDEFYADMAMTIAVGAVDHEVTRLIKTTKKALKRAINEVKPGLTIGSLGNHIDSFIEGNGFHNIIAMCGHGIGKNLHEEPRIQNHGKPGEGEKLIAGMTFCIEPMAAIGSPEIEQKGFAHKMKDNSLCAHFEHTVVVTDEGCEILTL